MSEIKPGKDYDCTPSYFNNCEYFNKYLGKTSYYIALQNALATCIMRLEPERVIDLGCALGTTTFMLADKFDKIEFSGLDMRDDVVSKTNKMQESRDYSGKDNATFICADMTNFVATEEISEYQLIYMLYSFHHIIDPDDNKIKFIQDTFNNMSSGSYLWIGETFLPENGMNVNELWTLRATEGHASTFWACLNDYKGVALKRAKEIAGISHDEEYKAGIHVNDRDEEYLVARSWTADHLEKAGFELIINEPVNALGDGVILVKKPGGLS